ncbi:hypothetical protein EDWATA_03790 [Edwardsiella tarda ATCC 23685]|uniref:Uncharacterized protein n=1 Tax=Edwardsiella tarda ATCC 23685 TaxID=500638 RepID=D4FAH1_EDWTA|nr:hypothetical protein EDWATA_03790 [Edwardsiella tarda ATCC 23685]
MIYPAVILIKNELIILLGYVPQGCMCIEGAIAGHSLTLSGHGLLWVSNATTTL